MGAGRDARGTDFVCLAHVVGIVFTFFESGFAGSRNSDEGLIFRRLGNRRFFSHGGGVCFSLDSGHANSDAFNLVGDRQGLAVRRCRGPCDFDPDDFNGHRRPLKVRPPCALADSGARVFSFVSLRVKVRDGNDSFLNTRVRPVRHRVRRAV